MSGSTSRHSSGQHGHGCRSSSEDHKAECQRLLTHFRVNELKELLRKLSQSQRGRKAELFQRANEILRHGSPKIQIHIREIYQRNHDTRHTSYSRYAQRGSPTANLHLSQVTQSPQRGQGYIVHPDVKFKAHPFFNKLESIIRPTALVSTAMTPSGSFSMRLQFHLTPRQVEQIYRSKNTQGEYLNQIIIRFARQETSCEQEDFYPKQCYIKVNDNYVPIPGYVPQYSHRPDYKRNGRPVNITNYIKTSAAQTNDVALYWGHDVLYPHGFCVTIDHVESLSSSDLLTRLKSKGVRSPDLSKALVREKLAVDHDSEISATSLRISLICPLGKLRMTYPCRAMSCSHLQCFDANIYLQMNERKPRWICPVCDKPAPINELFIDGFFKEICEQSSSNDIEFKADGSWHSFSIKRIPQNIITPDSNKKYISVNSTPEKDSRKPNGTLSHPVVIDLTLSDSEDELEEEPISTSQTSHSRKSSTSSLTSSTSSGSDYYQSDPVERDTSSHSHPITARRTSHTSTHSRSSPHSSNTSRPNLQAVSDSSEPSASRHGSRTVSVITQGSPHPSVITAHPHSVSPAPHHQDLFHNSYHNDPLLAPFPLDDSLFSLLNFDLCPSDDIDLID